MARPANTVWSQAHEITSGFGQSQSPSGKTGEKYSFHQPQPAFLTFFPTSMQSLMEMSRKQHV